LGIGLVPFSPLRKGHLTGSFSKEATFAKGDFRNILPRFTQDALAANQAIVDLLKKDSRPKRSNPGTNSFSLVISAKILDCSYTGNNKTTSPERKS